MKREDWSFIIIVVFLAFSIFLNLDYMRIGTEFLFEPTPLGTSIFGMLSSYSILIGFMIWGAIKTKAQLVSTDLVGRIRIAGKKTIRFIGIGKPTLNDTLFILFSLLVGVSLNLFTQYVISVLINGNVVFSGIPKIDIILQNMVVAPVMEEVVYRAIPLSVLLRILGKKYSSAIFGIVLSSAIFGWIHPIDPELKALGGMVLGCIYLFQWRKNLIASVSAHLGVNIVGTFLLVQS